jgi:hypothetical protein
MINRLSFLVLSAASMLSSGCLLFGAAPPGRTDVGPALLASSDKAVMGVRFTAGAHLASAMEQRVPYDVGIGYVLKTGDREPVDPLYPHEQPALRVYHGGYLEGAYGFQLGKEKWSRSWIGARAEVTGDGGYGFVGRWAWEASAYVDGPGGLASGKAAFVGVASGRIGGGVFCEAGYQSLPDGDARLNAAMISMGVTLRFPAFAFIGLVFPN